VRCINSRCSPCLAMNTRYRSVCPNPSHLSGAPCTTGVATNVTVDTTAFGGKSVAVSKGFACIVLSSNETLCQSPTSSDLSIPGAEPLFDDSGAYVALRAYVTFDGTAKAQQLAAGLSHICAVSTDARLFCWGSSAFGQTGHDTDGYVDSPSQPVAVGTGFDVLSVTAGGTSACALLLAPPGGGGLRNRGVRCWGGNDAYQLGIGPLTQQPNSSALTIGADPLAGVLSIPLVSLGAQAQSVACGTVHCCAVLVGGSLRCWGANDVGQLGLGSGNIAPFDFIGDDEFPSDVPAVAFGLGINVSGCGGSHDAGLARVHVVPHPPLRCRSQRS
jgi:alpha-tubulin suppressor-like RCC1 family protein